MKKILILIDKRSWFNRYKKNLTRSISKINNYKIKISHDHTKIRSRYNFCFFISYSKIVEESFLGLVDISLVVHESDLPKGKGMSPLTWQILEGKNEIPITLSKVAVEIDSGDIFLKDIIRFRGDELVWELRERQAFYTVKLVSQFLKKHPRIKPRKQRGRGSFYRKRVPEDSEIDIDKPFKEQINLLRVVDNDVYPAFFYYKNIKYYLKVTKVEKS